MERLKPRHPFRKVFPNISFQSLTRHATASRVASLPEGNGHFVQRDHDWIICEGKGKDSRVAIKKLSEPKISAWNL
jgi:hypothetical protein